MRDLVVKMKGKTGWKQLWKSFAKHIWEVIKGIILCTDDSSYFLGMWILVTFILCRKLEQIALYSETEDVYQEVIGVLLHGYFCQAYTCVSLFFFYQSPILNSNRRFPIKECSLLCNKSMLFVLLRPLSLLYSEHLELVIWTCNPGLQFLRLNIVLC